MPVMRTTEVAPSERFDCWRQLVSSTFLPLKVLTTVPDDFRGKMHTGQLGGLGLTRIDADSHQVRRGKTQISNGDPDCYKLSLQLSGTGILVQDGRQAALGPADFAIYDTTRPYTLAFDDAFQALVLMFPRNMLALSPRRMGELTALRISGEQGIGKIIATLLTEVAENMDDLSDYEIGLPQNIVDLLGTAFSQHAASPNESSCEHRTLLHRIKFYIEHNLPEHDLSPDRIAGAHHISTRLLHKLFRAEGMTVSEWIRTRRLEHCRHDLRDPWQAQRPIGAVAAAWGLTDAAHFSRIFKATYGSSPRQCRAQAQALSADT